MTSLAMRGASSSTSLVYLLGSPGVGKRTVAEALAAPTGALVLDNHRINLPIMSLFDWNGSERLPPEVWGYVEAIRSAVLDALADIAPRDASDVLTNALEVGYEAWFDRIEGIAHARRSVFVPVLLVVDTTHRSADDAAALIAENVGRITAKL